jgi:hypothetical protein
MKTLLSFFFFAVIAGAPAYSQKLVKPKTAEEVIEALCHTWKASSLQSGSINLPVPAKSAILHLILKSDGTYTRSNRDGEISGKWTYRPKVMIVELEDSAGGKPLMIGYDPGTFELKYKISNSPPDYIVLKKAE